MATKYPGTTIEVLNLRKGDSKVLFDGIFATGGITLSQVCNMTDLEPYMIQNWVKRKFVRPPVKSCIPKNTSRESLSSICSGNPCRSNRSVISFRS